MENEAEFLACLLAIGPPDKLMAYTSAMDRPMSSYEYANKVQLWCEQANVGNAGDGTRWVRWWAAYKTYLWENGYANQKTEPDIMG